MKNIPTNQSFQFHKGAIRTMPKEISDKFDAYFNSIKVRLERIVLLIIMVNSVFQFHKGAIRTLEGDLLQANLDISIP